MLEPRLLTQDGGKLSSTDLVAPGNLFLSTMFENCYLALNGVQVSDSANFYPHLAYIQKHLSLGEAQKKTELTKELYYKNTKGDEYNKSTNSGFGSRLDLAAGSKPFEMIGKISSSIFAQKRYLPTHVDMTVVLRRSQPEFALSSATTSAVGVSGCPWKIKVEEAVLFVRKHVLHPKVLTYHNSLFSQGKKALFPIRRTLIRSIVLPTGSLGTTGEVLFNGVLPEILTIGLVSAAAMGGALNKDPFNFHHYKMTMAAVTVDNDPAVYRSLAFDFANQQYLQGFHTLQKAVGYTGDGNYLSRADYSEGNTLIVFDLQPSAGAGGRFQIERVGQVKIELKFSEGLLEPVALLAYAQFQSSIQIDSNRNIHRSWVKRVWIRGRWTMPSVLWWAAIHISEQLVFFRIIT
jgi:hypothetical protein